jgi:HAUS augmin-like complex subunit 1
MAVQEWLESVFAGDQVPDYEITQRVVDQLWQLATACRERERRVEAVVDDLEQKTREYAAETERLRSVQDWVGVSMPGLSETAQRCVQSVAGTAVALGARHCSDTSLCLSLTGLLERQATLTARESKMQRESERREEELRHAIITQATQKQALAEFSQQLSAEAGSVNHQKKNAEFFAKKSSQYQKLITSLKSELQQAGYSETLSHAALQQTSMEIEELQAKLEPLRAQLSSYQGLPPDLDLAKVKVEAARRQLVRLEVELSRCLDLVHTEK